VRATVSLRVMRFMKEEEIGKKRLLKGKMFSLMKGRSVS